MNDMKFAVRGMMKHNSLAAKNYVQGAKMDDKLNEAIDALQKYSTGEYGEVDMDEVGVVMNELERLQTLVAGLEATIKELDGGKTIKTYGFRHLMKGFIDDLERWGVERWSDNTDDTVQVVDFCVDVLSLKLKQIQKDSQEDTSWMN